MKPTNDYEALVLALTLAINAPDDAKAAQCVDMAESIAANLSELDVQRAKNQAQKQVRKQNMTGEELKIESWIHQIQQSNAAAGDQLQKQMIYAKSGEYSIEDLSDSLKGKEDVADLFYNDNDLFHVEIRNIQDAIIGYYGQ